MATMTAGKKAGARPTSVGYPGSTLIQTRLHNVGEKFLGFLKDVPEEKLVTLLTLSDEEFWTELKYTALSRSLIDAETPEKKEQEEIAEARIVFLETLKESGGVHKSTKAAEILSVSIPTVHKYGKSGKIIELDWGAERLYPAFQFALSPDDNEGGLLKGFPDLLARIKYNVSVIRKCNFFTRKNEMPESGEKVSAIEILRRGATKDELEHLRILAENFGSNHTM